MSTSTERQEDLPLVGGYDGEPVEVSTTGLVLGAITIVIFLGMFVFSGIAALFRSSGISILP